jgi:hypothetical protein
LSIEVRSATAFADCVGLAVADGYASTPAAAIAASTIVNVRVIVYLLLCRLVIRAAHPRRSSA